MNKRIRRTNSVEELIALLASGVRDLDFDSVQVLHLDNLVATWTQDRSIHSGRPRTQLKKSLDVMGISIRWVVPQHGSRSYCKYLNHAWYVFLHNVATRLRELEEEHLIHWQNKELLNKIHYTTKLQ